MFEAVLDTVGRTKTNSTHAPKVAPRYAEVGYDERKPRKLASALRLKSLVHVMELIIISIPKV